MKLAAMLLSASLLVPVAAGTAAAQSRHSAAPQSYEECVRQQRNRQVAGAVIGGILGAVVGAEIHDDRQDRAREHRRYGRYGRYGHYRSRYGHRRHRGYRHHRHEEGNDGAVAVGGLLGATAGAAVAGSARGCERLARAGYGHDDPGYGQDYGYDHRRYDERRYDDRRYDERYSGADYGYSDGYDAYDGRRYSNDTLAGGPDAHYGYDQYADPAPSRTSSASARVYTAGGGASCRWMSAGANGEVRMCQGADGIWRPAD